MICLKKVRNVLRVVQRYINLQAPSFRWSPVLAITVAIIAYTLPATAEEPAVARAAGAISECRQSNQSNGETSICYSKILTQLQAEVRRAHKRRLEELGERPAADYGGRRNLRRFKQAMRDADRQWKAVIRTECGPLIEAEFYGGQGQGLFAQLCQLNLLATRLDSQNAARR